MSTRAATWLAGGMWGLSVILAALNLLLLEVANASFLEDGSYVLPFLAFTTVGALIASRRPDNAIGWLFCIVGLTNILWFFAQQYAVHTLVTQPGALPGGTVMAWLGTGWIATVGWGLMVTFVLLLFPNGRLLSRRWRPIAWLIVILLTLQVVIQSLTPGPIDERYPSIHNPVGIEPAADLLDGATNVVYPALLVLLPAVVASVVLRFRRAKGEERQQLKWFTYAAFLLLIAYVINIVLSALLLEDLQTQNLPLLIEALLWFPPIFGFPVATGIAILKYRLYDIDLIIRRTLIYGVLTGALALVYFGSVVLLQSVFRAFTGQTSQLVIVASTLAIAALFNPLRRRVQDVIDRRFYRHKYDAAKTLAAFSTTVRDETDLDKLTEALVAVVEETMQPAHVSLWLPQVPERLRPSDREVKR